MMGSDISCADRTIVTDSLPGKWWRCPHCGKRNTFAAHKDEILMEHLKYIESCDHCGYLHYWELQLSEDFKQKVVALMHDMI